MTDTEFAAYVLGRRFGCDLRVAGVGPGPTVLLIMHGATYEMSLDELRTLVERGFIVELPLPSPGDDGPLRRR